MNVLAKDVKHLINTMAALVKVKDVRVIHNTLANLHVNWKGKYKDEAEKEIYYDTVREITARDQQKMQDKIDAAVARGAANQRSDDQKSDQIASAVESDQVDTQQLGSEDARVGIGEQPTSKDVHGGVYDARN